MYFFKAFFKNGTVDYVITTFPVRRPKSIDTDCIKVERISVFKYFFCKIFHPHT